MVRILINFLYVLYSYFDGLCICSCIHGSMPNIDRNMFAILCKPQFSTGLFTTLNVVWHIFIWPCNFPSENLQAWKSHYSKIMSLTVDIHPNEMLCVYGNIKMPHRLVYKRHTSINKCIHTHSGKNQTKFKYSSCLFHFSACTADN